VNITTNRKAYFEYFILDKIEAGIVLQGTEVKSIRSRCVSLDGSYVAFEDGELWLVDCYINEYSHGNIYNHTTKRPRKLLLKKREIKNFSENLKIKGNSILPLSLYFKNGFVKVELGICKGKKKYDKRETIKKKDAERDMSMSN
jgi:SsrA-binding protein